MTYQRFPIETDPDALAQDSYQLLSDKTAGVWQPADGNLDTWLIEATARQAAEVRDVAADVPDTIFMTYGQTLVNLPPFQATSAQAVLDVTLRDQAAYLIPAGTTFGVDDLAGTPHAFALQEDVSIPASTSGPATPVVELVAFALEPGSDANAIDPRAGNAYLLDAITAIQSVTLSETTSGGNDGESDQDYMNRLAETLQLLTPRPVLAVDYAKLALQVPGVGYACAINLYDPGPPIVTNQERCVTVVLTDPAGQPVSSSIKHAGRRPPTERCARPTPWSSRRTLATSPSTSPTPSPCSPTSTRSVSSRPAPPPSRRTWRPRRSRPPTSPPRSPACSPRRPRCACSTSGCSCSRSTASTTSPRSP